jgi:hypothetical protein
VGGFCGEAHTHTRAQVSTSLFRIRGQHRRGAAANTHVANQARGSLHTSHHHTREKGFAALWSVYRGLDALCVSWHARESLSSQ